MMISGYLFLVKGSGEEWVSGYILRGTWRSSKAFFCRGVGVQHTVKVLSVGPRRTVLLVSVAKSFSMVLKL